MHPFALLFVSFVAGSAAAREGQEWSECDRSSSDRAAVLVPGNGFDKETILPQSPATGPGSNAKAIARWNCVPFQSVEGVFEVGVVAFHRNGIDRVEFSTNGGPWVAVREMTQNPRTGTFEYWVRCRREFFGKGDTIELRAVAYPKGGIPRVLDPLFLSLGSRVPNPMWAAPEGSDTMGDGSEANPFRSMWRAAEALQGQQGGDAGGGVVYLKPGDYEFTTPRSKALETRERWLTFQPAPGVGRYQVSVVASAFPGIVAKLVRLANLSVRTLLHGDPAKERYLWLDGCHLFGAGQQTSVHPVGWYWGFEDVFLTKCRVTDNEYGPRGATLVRDCIVRRIGHDCLDGTAMVINTEVRNVSRGSRAEWHPDVLDFWAPTAIDNFIVFGLRVTNAEAQGLYAGHNSGSVNNVALVNVLMKIGGGPWVSQWELPADHILIWNCSFVEHRFNWRTPASSLTNLSIRGSYFDRMGIDVNPAAPSPGGDSLDESWFDQNHFRGPNTLVLGAGSTSGEPAFLNPLADDYRPAPGSVLLQRMPALVPVDLCGIRRVGLSSVGVYH